jgi:predicted small lipoprotein YifL
MARIFTLALVVLILAGCGARGGLEPPPDANPKKDKPIVLDPLI